MEVEAAGAAAKLQAEQFSVQSQALLLDAVREIPFHVISSSMKVY